MVLSDRDIKKYIEERKIVIEPFSESRIYPASYSFSLGHTLLKPIGNDVIDFKKNFLPEYREIIIDEIGYTIEPGNMQRGLDNKFLNQFNVMDKTLHFSISIDNNYTKKFIPKKKTISNRNPYIAPYRRQKEVEKVKEYVDLGVKEGAKIIVDGRNIILKGYENGFYIGSYLFDHVKKDKRIYKEEIFGPVLSVERANDFYEATQLVNDHEFGN